MELGGRDSTILDSSVNDRSQGLPSVYFPKDNPLKKGVTLSENINRVIDARRAFAPNLGDGTNLDT